MYYRNIRVHIIITNVRGFHFFFSYDFVLKTVILVIALHKYTRPKPDDDRPVRKNEPTTTQVRVNLFQFIFSKNIFPKILK